MKFSPRWFCKDSLPQPGQQNPQILILCDGDSSFSHCVLNANLHISLISTSPYSLQQRLALYGAHEEIFFARNDVVLYRDVHPQHLHESRYDRIFDGNLNISHIVWNFPHADHDHDLDEGHHLHRHDDEEGLSQDNDHDTIRLGQCEVLLQKLFYAVAIRLHRQQHRFRRRRRRYGDGDGDGDGDGFVSSPLPQLCLTLSNDQLSRWNVLAMAREHGWFPVMSAPLDEDAFSKFLETNSRFHHLREKRQNPVVVSFQLHLNE